MNTQGEESPQKKSAPIRYDGIDFRDKNSHRVLKYYVELVCKDGVVLYAERRELSSIPYFDGIFSDRFVGFGEGSFRLQFEENSKVLEIILYYVYGLFDQIESLIQETFNNPIVLDELLALLDSKICTELIQIYLRNSLSQRKQWNANISYHQKTFSLWK